MSKYLNHTELIGSYLEGSMTPDQMLEFENQLHTDPLLRSEFELQQDIVNSLKDFRKSQLKARLDQVPVSVSPVGMIGVKTAAVFVLSGIIGIGAYLYFSSSFEPKDLTAGEDTMLVEESPATVSEIPEIQKADQEETSSPQLQEVEAAPKVDVSDQTVAEEVNTNPVTKVVREPATVDNSELLEPEEITETEEVPTPVVNSPEVIDPSLQEDIQEENLEVPTAAIAQKELADNPVVEIETAKKDNTLFHYQYYSGKLYLYGDFRDIPYEILELNSSTGKKLFMFYNQEYFQIMDNQKDLTPLTRLQDQEIIKELDIIRENK